MDAIAALPGVPGSQVFDTTRNWPLIGECIREALSQRRRCGRPRSRRSAARACARGWSCTTPPGREIWACPNVDSRAGDEAAELVRSGDARRIFETGGDWVSITSPARFRWIRDHEPEVFAAIAHVGHAQRLGPLPADRPVRHRPVVGLELRPVRPARADLVARARSDLVGLDPAIVPEVLEPGTVVGPLTARAADETGLAAGTPVVVGGADTQLGLVGIGVVRPDRVTLVGGSFWQLTVGDRRAAHRSRRRGSGRSATRCPASG